MTLSNLLQLHITSFLKTKTFQFYRSFPRPSEVTERDVDLLVKKYRDPDRPGLLNYLNLYRDLVAVGKQMMEESTILKQVTNISEFLPPQVSKKKCLQTHQA